MSTDTERRTHSRHSSESPVLYAKYNSKIFKGAKTYNSSSGGMNLVVNRPLEPGSEICIKPENYLENRYSTEGYRAKVVWCQEVSNVYASYYGNWEAGIRYYDSVNKIIH